MATPKRPRTSGAPTSRPRRVAGDRPPRVEPVVEPVAEPVVESGVEPAPRGEALDEGPVVEEPSDDHAAGAPDGMAALFAGRRPTVALGTVIAVLVVALVAMGAYLAVADEPDPAAARRVPKGQIAVPADRPVALSPEEAQQAVAAAAEAASTIVATSYEDYDDQVDEATELMTPGFAEEFRTLAGEIKQAFVAARTTIEVRVVAQGVVRANTSQVQALVFLNQYVTKGGPGADPSTDPTPSPTPTTSTDPDAAAGTTYTPYRALVTVVHTDRGWLVSGIDTR